MSTWIDQLSKNELEAQLEAYGIISSGNTDSLRGRLRQFVTTNPELFDEYAENKRTNGRPRRTARDKITGTNSRLEPDSKMESPFRREGSLRVPRTP